MKMQQRKGRYQRNNQHVCKRYEDCSKTPLSLYPTFPTYMKKYNFREEVHQKRIKSYNQQSYDEISNSESDDGSKDLEDINEKIEKANQRKLIHMYSTFKAAQNNNQKVDSIFAKRKELEITESLTSLESLTKFLEKCRLQELTAQEKKIHKVIEKCLKIQKNDKIVKTSKKIDNQEISM